MHDNQMALTKSLVLEGTSKWSAKIQIKGSTKVYTKWIVHLCGPLPHVGVHACRLSA